MAPRIGELHFILRSALGQSPLRLYNSILCSVWGPVAVAQVPAVTIMNNLGAWLESLGLGDYSGVFAEHAIDEEILPDLTDADLKELGIPLGHRKKLLKAINAFGGDGAGGEVTTTNKPRATAPELPPDSEVSLAAWKRMPGERRPVTMLFADITGSTALTEKLDSEETHDLLYGATRLMCEAVEDNRGTVCRFMGDGLMAMFGAPLASEHHAVDACEASLEMQDRIRAYARKVGGGGDGELKIRVGLHSGEVVVLKVGEGDKAEYDASGPTVPFAARMEQAAVPGDIYLTETTRSLAEAQIDVEALEPVRVKGISNAVPVFALRGVRSRQEGTLLEWRTPFVGRRAELAQFTSLLDAVLSGGYGQSVYVRGEPGIGKTRLTEEFARLAMAQGFVCHKGLVLDFGVGKGHEAIRALVRSLLDIPLRSDESERNTAANSAIKSGLLKPDQRVYLNDLLDLPQPVELRTLYDAMDNAKRNRGKQQVVSDLVTVCSARSPLLILIEDVHWAQPLTLAHLANLAITVGQCPTILVMTSRIERDPLDASWRSATGNASLMTMDLGPLRKEESEVLASGLTDVADVWVRQCIERAEGNPLFLEQLLRTAEEHSQSAVPDSIQSLVLARMDRLPVVDRQALQAASVIGQRFALDAVRYITEQQDYDCHTLVGNQLVRTEGEDFLFSHALIQEGVYSSLVKKTRRELHLRAAEWFEDSDVILYAQHLDQAGDPRAIDAYNSAIRAQVAEYRYERALQLCERGLAIATNPSQQHRFGCLKGDILLDLGQVDAGMKALEAALEVAENDVQRCESQILLAAGLRLSTEYLKALELLEWAEPVAVANGLDLMLARLHHLRGNLCFPLGRIEACREEHGKALESARKANSVAEEARALGGLGDAEYARGRMRTALGNFNRCVELCREHGFGRIEVAYLSMVPFGRLYLFEMEEAKRAGLEAVEAASAVGHQRAEMNARGGLCHIYTQLGDWDASLDHAERAMILCHGLGARAWEPVWLLWQSLAENGLGRRAEAHKLLTQAAEITAESDHAFNTGRVYGALALVTDDPSEREKMLKAGEAVLKKGTVSHNHFWFYQFAMKSTLETGEWDRVDGYAQALEDYTHSEPLPLTDFYIRWGRALAAHGRGDRSNENRNALEVLRDRAQQIGLKPVLPLIESALADKRE